MGLGEILTRPTAAERAAPLPGDEVVSPADVVMDRAFTPRRAAGRGVAVDRPAREAPGRVVLPGAGRAAGAAAATRPAPDRRRATRAWPSVTSCRTGVGADATFTVVGLEPGRHLLYGSTRGRTHLTWCLQLTPVGERRHPGAPAAAVGAGAGTGWSPSGWVGCSTSSP